MSKLETKYIYLIGTRWHKSGGRNGTNIWRTKCGETMDVTTQRLQIAPIGHPDTKTEPVHRCCTYCFNK